MDFKNFTQMSSKNVKHGELKTIKTIGQIEKKKIEAEKEMKDEMIEQEQEAMKRYEQSQAEPGFQSE